VVETAAEVRGYPQGTSASAVARSTVVCKPTQISVARAYILHTDGMASYSSAGYGPGVSDWTICFGSDEATRQPHIRTPWGRTMEPGATHCCHLLLHRPTTIWDVGFPASGQWVVANATRAAALTAKVILAANSRDPCRNASSFDVHASCAAVEPASWESID